MAMDALQRKHLLRFKKSVDIKTDIPPRDAIITMNQDFSVALKCVIDKRICRREMLNDICTRIICQVYNKISKKQLLLSDLV